MNNDGIDMKKLKCWKKGEHNSFHRTDGVKIKSYGRETTYPFVQIGTFYDSKVGKLDGFMVNVHTTHTSETLKERIPTKAKALAFARKYLEEHDSC